MFGKWKKVMWAYDYDIIKQALEKLESCEDLLEILMRNAVIVRNNANAPIVISISKTTSLKDWVTIKEWLENEKIKRARANS